MKESPEVLFTPEQELLLWSIRVDHTKDKRIEEILKAGVDWNYVQETAIQHGIIPLLYKRLKEEMEVLVPSNELEELRTLFMANAVRNIRMTQQLLKVLDLLADAGVEAMPFKGPALAVQAYGDLSMRSFGDVDILIHEKDLKKAYITLIRYGYISRFNVDTRSKERLLRFHKDLSFMKDECNLEIQWRIIEKFFAIELNIDDLWDRKIPLDINGNYISTISYEDTVIYQCIHGTKHLWGELKWLADLSFVIKNNPNLNLHTMLIRSENIGIKKIFLTSIDLAHQHCGLTYPIEIAKKLKSEPSIESLGNIINNNLFHKENGNRFLFYPKFYLKSREHVKDKLNYSLLSIVNLTIPNHCDFNFMTIPEILSPLYFIGRQVRLIKEFYFNLIQKKGA